MCLNSVGLCTEIHKLIFIDFCGKCITEFIKGYFFFGIEKFIRNYLWSVPLGLFILGKGDGVCYSFDEMFFGDCGGVRVFGYFCEDLVLFVFK